MAFKANTLALQNTLTEIMAIATQQKHLLGNWKSQLSGTITSIDGLNMLANLNRNIARLDELAVVPGLTEYAKAQFNTPGYNIGAEFTLMKNALVSLKNWLTTNLPSNSVSIVSGVLTGATYNTTATAPLLALVNSAIATID